MTDKNLYNKDSIESLDPLSFTRLKPGVYCGDTNYSTQLLVETKKAASFPTARKNNRY